MPELPDLRHLDKVREDLWKTPDLGQAVLMVGAGMSLNAEPLPGHSTTFPQWVDLARIMYDQLYPGDRAARAAERERAVAGLGATVVAREYEVAFGKPRLNQLLHAEIPDLAFRPSKLHERLLELPWADVFTTNFDTLLERAAEDKRRYQRILDIHDLPGSIQPRIVKLHGTLKVSARFIITDEDFRRYPQQYAPLVNTVQQALMENTMLLIGFSGDDPNFLAWTGWVRDQLGEHAPQIYLITLSRLPVPRIEMLKTRNVVPIDLSPIVSLASNLPGRNSYACALEWLIEALWDARPPSPFDWPNQRRASLTTLPPELPLPPVPPFARIVDIPIPPRNL